MYTDDGKLYKAKVGHGITVGVMQDPERGYRWFVNKDDFTIDSGKEHDRAMAMDAGGARAALILRRIYKEG